MTTQSSNLNTTNATGSIPVYSGFFRRAAALIIDSVVIMVANMLLFKLLLGAVTFDTYDTNRAASNLVGWLTLIIIVLYSALMESSPKQGTLGKMALGIKVTTLDGKRLSFINALGRAMLKFLSMMSLLIGCLIAAFTEKHQAFHDLPVGTIVVRKSWKGAGSSFQTEPFSGFHGQSVLQNQQRTASPPVPPADGSVTRDWNIAATQIKAKDQNVPNIVRSEFLQGLSSILNETGIPEDFSNADSPIKLKGHFILIDEGNRALRYFSSGISGKARVETEGVLLVNGTAVANLYARHELGLGFFVFGGDSPKLLGTCARNCGIQIAHQAVGILKTRRQ